MSNKMIKKCKLHPSYKAKIVPRNCLECAKQYSIKHQKPLYEVLEKMVKNKETYYICYEKKNKCIWGTGNSKLKAIQDGLHCLTDYSRPYYKKVLGVSLFCRLSTVKSTRRLWNSINDNGYINQKWKINKNGIADFKRPQK